MARASIFLNSKRKEVRKMDIYIGPDGKRYTFEDSRDGWWLSRRPIMKMYQIIGCLIILMMAIIGVASIFGIKL
jgi:hypothetical protein